MKKTTLITVILFFCFSQLIVAQNVLDKKNYKNKDDKTGDGSVEIFRDRMVIDLFQTFWLGMPSNVSSMKFNPGLNVSILWDIKKAPKSPFSFGLGGGVNYQTQNSDALLGVNPVSQITRYNIIPTLDTAFDICRVNVVSLYVPLEFRYRHSSGVKFTLGARIGYIVGLNQRYKGKDLSGGDQTLDYKNYDILNNLKYHFDFYARVGWKGLDLYYSYQVTSLFEDGKGPQIRPMSIGISISPF
ncbi:MAG: hypothetical protein CVU02_01870 [Bacteroidetes bacterium HGW-Bacteroidetes-19]|nr:MAG: hypothetical protein CVU04_00760 [Bacteroidetes bacterium HGW-Bacteroidetes-20]PKP28132.1 MAG: hypothetical protein CVU02_01870 [Bacteroidetes bacterium HGW-Bacteroidetes-19]